MNSIQSLYHQLRSQAFQDPIMRALAEGTMSWADAYTEADEQRRQEYCSTGEGADILNAVQALMTRKPKNRRGIQWAEIIDDVQVFDKDEPLRDAPIQVQQVTTTLLFNPNQIKTIVARNLPRDVSADELRNVFEKHGVVRDLYIPKNLDKNSPYFGTIKGFALIKYMSHMDSTRAFLAEQTNLCLRGKKIALEFAKEDR